MKMRGNDLVLISNCGMPITFLVGFIHIAIIPLSPIQISLWIIIPTVILSFIFIKRLRNDKCSKVHSINANSD